MYLLSIRKIQIKTDKKTIKLLFEEISFDYFTVQNQMFKKFFCIHL